MASITEEEIKEYQECFAILDKDEDGQLTREEVKQIVSTVQPAMAVDEDEINAFMEVGEIAERADEAKFRDAMIKKMTISTSKDELLEAFKVFDADGTGKIGLAELTQIMKVLGEGLISEPHMEVLLEKCKSKDDPETCNYNEWVDKVVKETFSAV